jgi:hypothetical protein
MPTSVSAEAFLSALEKSGLFEPAALAAILRQQRGLAGRGAEQAAEYFLRRGLLTEFQARQLLAGRYRSLILSRYKILRPLGKGGMGAVFLAEHAVMRRQVAVKILPPDRAKNTVDLERFYREGRAAARLDHPNIVHVFDIAEAGGVHFMVMEYVPGVTLQEMMDSEGALPVSRAADYVAQAAVGLQHAHEAGIVHRDVKPANLILDTQGVLKILDMGLARSFEGDSDGLTQKFDPNTMVGTPDYISPEQALNRKFDPRSDVYSLGGTLFALLTGRVPFQGSTVQKLMQHQVAAPPVPSAVHKGVPPELDAVVVRMMAKEPERRYQTAAEVVAALGPWLPGRAAETVRVAHADTRVPGAKSTAVKRVARKPADTRPATPAAPRPRRPADAAARRKVLIGTGAVAALALLGGLLLWALSGPSAASRPLPPVAAAPWKNPGVGATPSRATTYRQLSLAGVASACTNKSMVVGDGSEVFLLKSWGLKTIKGVPFLLLDPQNDQNNVLALYSPNTALSRKLPKSVTLPVGAPLQAVHFLGGTACWGWPFSRESAPGREWEGSPKGSVSARVRLVYADGRTEDHPLVNGVHLADLARRVDVPESQAAFMSTNNRQARYLAVKPQRRDEVRELRLLKGEKDNTSPLFLAVTVELAEGK